MKLGFAFPMILSLGVLTSAQTVEVGLADVNGELYCDHITIKAAGTSAVGWTGTDDLSGCCIKTTFPLAGWRACHQKPGSRLRTCGFDLTYQYPDMPDVAVSLFLPDCLNPDKTGICKGSTWIEITAIDGGYGYGDNYGYVSKNWPKCHGGGPEALKHKTIVSKEPTLKKPEAPKN